MFAPSRPVTRFSTRYTVSQRAKIHLAPFRREKNDFSPFVIPMARFNDAVVTSIVEKRVLGYDEFECRGR